MAQLTDAEIAELETMDLHCLICTSPMPKHRKATCSKECGEKLKKKRRHNIVSRKCPICYHPSTPQQRKEFQAWRRSRGELVAATPGRPPVKRTAILEALVRDLMVAARGAGMDANDEILLWAQNVLDPKGSRGVTIAASTTTESAEAQGES